MDPKSRRQSSRFVAGLSALVETARGVFSCRAENLSRTGVLLVGELPLDAGPTVRVTLASAAEDLKLTIPGRVVRVLPDPEEGQHRLGIDFDEIRDADRRVLEDLVSRVMEGMAPAAFDLRPGASAEEVRDALERVPLPHRVALAARAQVRDREILMHDANPMVLDALARNPQLNPLEFRALLRVRNLLPRTLQALARDGRWTGSEEQRILLASHPNMPFPDAERLATSLSTEGRRQLVQRPGVNPTLRMKLGQREKKR
jgi:hypothetical protein